MTLQIPLPTRVEHASEPPFYADGVTNIRVVGSAMHFAFYVDQMRIDGSEMGRVIVRDMIMPIGGVRSALPYVARMLPPIGYSVIAFVGNLTRRFH